MSQIDESIFDKIRMKHEISGDAIVRGEYQFGLSDIRRIGKSPQICGAIRAIQGNHPNQIAARLMGDRHGKGELELWIETLCSIRERWFGRTADARGCQSGKFVVGPEYPGSVGSGGSLGRHYRADDSAETDHKRP